MNQKTAAFSMDRLFDIHPTKCYKLTNRELFAKKGSIPVLSNSAANNGIGGYCGLKPTEPGNMITFSDTTTGTDTIFYQPDPFIGYPHVQGLYPLHPEDWDEDTCLYVIGVMKSACGGDWDYTTKFTRSSVLKAKLLLPIQTDGKGTPLTDISRRYHEKGYIPDWEEMRTYIRSLKQERVEVLKQERRQMLEQYLAAAGLDCCDLTDDDRRILSGRERMELFRLGDILEVSTPKKRFNANSIPVSDKAACGHYPYVVRTAAGNGIRGYIKAPKEYLNAGHTFSFGQDTATIFWQTEPYFTGDKIKILTPKRPLSDEAALFVAACVHKAFEHFSWGSQSFSEDVIRDVMISLPVAVRVSGRPKQDKKQRFHPNGYLPDWDHMQQYIKAIEKSVIIDTAKNKDELINRTVALV